MRMRATLRGGIAASVLVVGLSAGALSLASAGSRPAPPMGAWGQIAGATATDDADAQGAVPANATRITVLDDSQHGQGHFVDTPPRRRLNAGDAFVFEDPAKSADGSQTVGLIDGHCTFAVTKIICTATLHLNGRGKISAAGTAGQHGPFLMPVAGGTSEFLGARGELLGTPAGHGNTLLTFILLP